MLAVAVVPRDTEPKLHVTTAVPEHEPCDGVTETNAGPDGSVSVTITFVAGDGPLFVTTTR